MLSSRLGTCFSAWLVLDTEEIEKFCKSLSISEDDGKVVSLDRSLVLLGKRQMQNYLVGKILTNKKANMEAFKAVIHDVWKTVKIVMIECVGDNVLLFQFNSDGDKKRVFASGPWSFKNAIIVLKKLKGLGILKN